MYRAPITLLWAAAASFAAIATTDAFYDYAGSSRGLWIGLTCTSAVCAVLFHIGGAIICTNSSRNQQLAGDIQGDVDQLRGDLQGKVEHLRGQLGEVRDLAEAAVIGNEARKHDRDTAGDNQCDAVVYQFRLRHPDGHDVIVGKRTCEPIDNTEEFLRALDANDTGTLPGHFSAS